MIRRLTATAAFLVVAHLFAGWALAADRPNILVILADDQGWGDLSVHGNTNLSTPNIDSLARDGRAVRPLLRLPGLLADAGGVPHRPLPPARAACAASRPAASGSTSTRRPSPTRSRPPATPPAPSASGTTARSIPTTPTPAASTSTTASCSGHWGDYFDPPLEHNGQLVRGKGYITDDLTEPRDGLHRGEPRPAVLLLPAVQHAPLADAGPRPVLREVRGCRAEAARHASPAARTWPSPAPRWRCARTSTGTSAALLAKLDELKLAERHHRRLLQRQRPE